MLHDLLTFFAGTYADVFNITEGPPLHDPIAVAVLLDPTLLPTEKPPGDFSKHGTYFQNGNSEDCSVHVVTNGQHVSEEPDGGQGTVLDGDHKVGQVGRTILRDGNLPGIVVPRAVSLTWFWDQLLDAVERAEAAAGID